MTNSSIKRFKLWHPVLKVNPTYQLNGIVLEDLDNLTLITTSSISSANTNQNLVAMKHGTHLAGPEENIISLLVADDKTEAIRVSRNRACKNFQLICHRIDISAIDNDLPIAHHGSHSKF